MNKFESDIKNQVKKQVQLWLNNNNCIKINCLQGKITIKNNAKEFKT